MIALLIQRFRRRDYWLREEDRGVAEEFAVADPRLEGVFDNALYRAFTFLKRQHDTFSIRAFQQAPKFFESPNDLYTAAKIASAKTSPDRMISDAIHAGATGRDLAIALWAHMARAIRPDISIKEKLWFLLIGWALYLPACLLELPDGPRAVLGVLGGGLIFAVSIALTVESYYVHKSLAGAEFRARFFKLQFEGIVKGTQWLRAILMGCGILLLGVLAIIALTFAIIAFAEAASAAIRELQLSTPAVLVLGGLGVTITLPLMGSLWGRRCLRRSDRTFDSLVEHMEQIRQMYLAHCNDVVERG